MFDGLLSKDLFIYLPRVIPPAAAALCSMCTLFFMRIFHWHAGIGGLCTYTLIVALLQFRIMRCSKLLTSDYLLIASEDYVHQSHGLSWVHS